MKLSFLVGEQLESAANLFVCIYYFHIEVPTHLCFSRKHEGSGEIYFIWTCHTGTIHKKTNVCKIIHKKHKEKNERRMMRGPEGLAKLGTEKRGEAC